MKSTTSILKNRINFNNESKEERRAGVSALLMEESRKDMMPLDLIK